MFPVPSQACGDHNGKLAIYDLERNDVAVWSADAHKSIINSVDGLGGPDSTYGAPELVGDTGLDYRYNAMSIGGGLGRFDREFWGEEGSLLLRMFGVQLP